MSMPSALKTTSVTVTRQIKGAPEAVYDVWLDKTSPGGPWFGPHKVILNPVVDGLFYHMVEHAGRTWPHFGRFVTLDRGATIVHTWMSPSTKGLESTVTLTFVAKDGGCELTLTHSGIPDDPEGLQHKDGWGYVLDMLSQKFAGTLNVEAELAKLKS